MHAANFAKLTHLPREKAEVGATMRPKWGWLVPQVVVPTFGPMAISAGRAGDPAACGSAANFRSCARSACEQRRIATRQA